MEKIFEQPNGKYCSINNLGELIFFDYTQQDIINMYIENTKEKIKKAKSSGDFIKEVMCIEKLERQRIVSDEHLKSMGFEKTYNELTKFIPRTPINTYYVSCNFATYGNCPNCGKQVQDGIDYTDKKCSCGQILEW